MGYERITKRAGIFGALVMGGVKFVGPVFNPGRRALAVLRVAANVADAQTVTIGTDVYEFDRAANGVVAGRIAVTGHADDTPANATNALIAKINSLTGRIYQAIDIGDNEILIATKTPRVSTLALAETLAGVDNVWDTAALRAGQAAGIMRTAYGVRVPNATEVALGNMHFVFDFTPVAVIVQVRVTASGAVFAWGGNTVITDASHRVTLTNNATNDFADTHTVTVLAIG